MLFMHRKNYLDYYCKKVKNNTRVYNARIELTTTDGRGNASVVEQNVLGWVLKSTDALGNATTTAYDLAHGKPSCVTDALGKTHRYAYDLRGNVVAEFGSGVHPAVFEFDDADRKVSQRLFRSGEETIDTDPRERTDGDETTWTYHEATGLLLSKTYPDESRVDYAYDALNRLATTTLAREVSPGVRLKLTRAYADLTGELVSLTSNDGNGEATPPSVNETWVYDFLGRLVSRTDSSGATSYQYDEYGALSEETKSGGLFVPTKTLTYHRDEFGRDAGYSIDGARKTTLSYDPATGRIASVSVSGAGVFSWEYLAGTSLKSKLTYPNSATAEWAYEEKRDLLASVKNTVNGSVISRYAYENDAAGRRVSSVKSGAMMGAEAETLSYGYDARGALVSAISDVNPAYAYGYGFDEAGNRNSATEAGRQLAYTTNALNQYASVSEGETSFVPEYDLDGNATRLRTSTGTWSVEYDAHNRPVAWRKTTGEVVYMIYDAQGRRAEKRVLNAAGKRTLRERYVYVGYTCVQVLNGDKNNALVKEFAWDPTEPTATRPLTFRYAEKSLMLFYAFDGNKNVSDVFFLALQNGIGAHYEYAPFGAVTRTAKATGSKVDLIGANPWRFSSEFHDSELDLVYYNYRHYSPALGRWLSRDPIEERGGLNLYAFVGNVPTSFVDNQGGFAVAIGGVIGGSFLVPGLIGIGIGAAVVVSVGIVVIGSAIIIDRIIDSLPQTETSLEEEAKTSDDAIPITQCPPCPDRKKRCAPCNPPVDTVMYRHDTTGRPHYVPETGKRELPHYNNYVVYQVPYKEGNPHSCECRYREIDATLVPLAGATPFRRPTGGGVIIM